MRLLVLGATSQQLEDIGHRDVMAAALGIIEQYEYDTMLSCLITYEDRL